MQTLQQALESTGITFKSTPFGLEAVQPMPTVMEAFRSLLPLTVFDGEQDGAISFVSGRTLDVSGEQMEAEAVIELAAELTIVE